MSRISVAALLLGLAAAPAFAASEDEAAASRSLEAQALRQNTLQQNQRAFVAPPARPPAAQSQPGKTPSPAAAAPAAPNRRLAAADQPRR